MIYEVWQREYDRGLWTEHRIFVTRSASAAKKVRAEGDYRFALSRQQYECNPISPFKDDTVNLYPFC